MDNRVAAATAMARTVKRARGALVDAVSAALSAAEGSTLRPVHAQVFECLDPGGTRLTTLAERAQMSHQAMGELVGELVEQGYLERVPDPVDRRARLIRPTARGRAELVRAGTHLAALYRRWERALGRVHGPAVADVVAALDVLIRICEDTTDRAASGRALEGRDR